MRIPFTNRVINIQREKRQRPDDVWGARSMRVAKSGSYVNEFTALQSSAVWACIRVLSSQLASYPLIIYQRVDKGKERATTHSAYPLLHDAPNSIQTSAVFRSTAMTHLCLHGNAYAEIQHSGKDIAGLWQIPPWKVRVEISPNNRGLIYEVTLPDGSMKKLPDWKMLHFVGLSTDGFTGLAPITQAREAIGLSLAAEEFGATYFGEGTNIGGILQHPAELSDAAFTRLKQSMKEQYSGLGKQHRMMLLEEGMKFEKLTIPPDQSQFLQTRQFQVLEICRMFGVPPHMVAELDRATFSNIEEQAISFITHTMQPWLVNWEQELNRKLFPDTPYFAEFLLEGALRGRTVDRYQAYQTARNWGWLSANDIRAMENLNPLPGEQGDMYLVPLNMQPAEYLLTPEEVEPTGEPIERPSGDTAENIVEGEKLTGVQIQAAIEVVNGMIAGAFPPKVATELLVAVGIDRQRAEEMVKACEVFEPKVQPLDLEPAEAGRSEVRSVTKNRHFLARSYRKPFEAAGERIVAREVQNVRRAVKKHLGQRDVKSFKSWLEDFYRDFPQYIQDQLRAVSYSLAEAIEPLVKQQLKKDSTADIQAFVREYLRTYATRHVISSQGQIESLLDEDDPELAIEERITAWQEKRPGKIGMNETVQLSNAVALTMFAGAGVSYIVWRNTSGKSCPYCERLDGKRMKTGDDFVEDTASAKGEEDMKIRRPAMQPPLHRGCQCQIEPE